MANADRDVGTSEGHPEKSDFLAAFAFFLDSQTQMTREDRSAAKKLLDERFYTLNLRRSGPCVRCGQHISYGKLSRHHKAKNDSWLDRLKADFCSQKSMIRIDSYGFTLYGLKPDNVMPYLCEICHSFIHAEVDRIRTEAAEERKRYLKGLLETAFDTDGYPTKRLQCFKEYMQQSGQAHSFESHMRSLPYQEFLHTQYWDMVRAYVKHKARFKCQICSGPNPEVHHRSYEYRGCEYRRLDDLIALCRACHGKYHDKLPEL